MPVRALVGLLVVAAVLHFARDVLIPFALAVLLAFLLAPAVRALERLRLGRILSTFAVVLAGTAVVGGVGWVAGNQAVSVVAKLPEYRENISEKLRSLRAPPGGKIGKAARALQDLEKQAQPTPQRPVPVTQAPQSPVAQLAAFAAPFAKPAGMALAVFVLTILFLLHRENMRERVIALIGPRRINVTTQALGEASFRVSRYLFMQLVVNATFGVPFGAALYFIGIPNALLWGLLATLLRFVPYIGVWIAAGAPVLLAFAIGEDWTKMLEVLGVFLALELPLSNFIEPWAYGRSAGLSPIAVIAAAMFWTWLWGPIGLLVATPLTVCVAVIGRYIPELGYLNVILGVEPVLTPEARFYQRLLAMDHEEAEELAEQYAQEHGLLALHEQVVVPALALAEQDRNANALDAEHQRFVFDLVRHVIEEGDAGREAKKPEARVRKSVCILAAHDEADHLAGLALGRLLELEGIDARVADFPLLAAEAIERVAEQSCEVVCISAVPPRASAYAAYLCKRLRARRPEAKIVIGLWNADHLERARQRLTAAGADLVVTCPGEALAQLAALAA